MITGQTPLLTLDVWEHAYYLDFALLETGFTRAKNAVHTMAMNFVIYPVGVLGFWLLGFGFMYGGVGGWPALGGAVLAHQELGFRLGGTFFGLLGTAKFALARRAL